MPTKILYTLVCLLSISGPDYYLVCSPVVPSISELPLQHCSFHTYLGHGTNLQVNRKAYIRMYISKYSFWVFFVRILKREEPNEKERGHPHHSMRP